MYFASRAEAGAKLASELIEKYRWENTAVLALDQGGVAIGYQIAIYLHARLRRFFAETIRIDDESVDFAFVMPGGVVAPSPTLSESEYSYYYGEYAGFLEEKLREATRTIDEKITAEEISPEIYHGMNVILCSDGLQNGNLVDAVVTWLKPAHTEKLILATPIASVAAVDRAHILTDELHILATTPNYLFASHYYDQNDEPDEILAKKMLNATILDWR